MKTDYINQAARQAITAGRSALLIDQPFFGMLAMRLKLVEDTGIKTLATDGAHMKYNPNFVLSLSPTIVKSALGHEVLHCALEHCGQGRNLGKEPQKWNWAADYAVNSILKESNFELGEGWLYNPAFKDLTAEAIYNMIPDPPQGGSGGGGGGAPSADKPGPLDQIEEGDANQNPSEAAQQQTEWKVATLQAAAAAKACGKLSSVLERFIDEAMEPQVDWRDELRAMIDTIARDDFSWQRPNRKMMAMGYILPGLYSEHIARIDIASDESGSILDPELQVFAREIRAILEDVNPEKIRVLHFAAHVGCVEEFDDINDFKLEQKITGGTDFRPIFKEVDSHDDKPAVLVILTDMEAPFPAVPPDYPVVWCSTTSKKAPFGHTVHVDIKPSH